LLVAEADEVRNRFGTIHTVLNYTGKIFLVFGAVLLLPLVFVPIFGEYRGGYSTILAFAIPSVISMILGIFLKKAFREGKNYAIRSMLICGVAWTGCSAIGAIPFVIGLGTGYLDAYFETMSGFTTTGITMLSGLDTMPASILFWRSLTQWLGGIGILAFVLAIGVKGLGAHRLFSAESHKIDMGRPVPGLFNTVRTLWLIYIGFTLAVFAALSLSGMGVFDSLCHSLTTLSTGGYSPHDASIEHYRLIGHSRYVLIEYIIIAGMLLGGINFLVHYRVIRGKVGALFSGVEMKFFWGIAGSAVVLILVWRYFGSGQIAVQNPGSVSFWKTLEENFRITTFQVTSIMTTTGYATKDIASQWFGPSSRLIFLALMFIGGCVGSTGGGFKVLRIAILTKVINRELFRLRTPLGSVSTIVVDGEPVRPEEIQRITGLFFVWAAMAAAGGIATAVLSRFGGIESLSGMFSAINNVGPCFIPATEFPQMSPAIKLVWIFGMLAGRLEILPALLLLSRRAWQY
jgi:trk system potassium uptake protein TrkH